MRCQVTGLAVLLASLLASSQHEEPAAWPRYVLCEEGAASVSNGQVTIFAASVSGDAGETLGRASTAPTLRAAILNHGDWEILLPKTLDGMETAGHAKHVSYAKCVGSNLPSDTEVACRMGSGASGRHFAENASWEEGSLATFDTGELRANFAFCELSQRDARRWRRKPDRWPKRLHWQLGLRNGDNDPAVFLLELCRVDRPLMDVSFCSQPLYNFAGMKEELPFVMEDWLAYHLDYLGFDHGEIYDIDGSFAEALEPWAKASVLRSSTLTYHRQWPKQLSDALEALSQTQPYCTENFAYAHCLTRHNALSRWVALLHAPDEYINLHKHRYPGALKEVMAYIGSDLPENQIFSFFQVNAVSLARGGINAEESRGRGAVIAANKLRMPMPYHHMPLIDPFNCLAAGPHMCYREVGAPHVRSGITKEVPPLVFVVHHYVEMVDRNKGRCGTMDQRCFIPENSLDFIVPWLRSL